jgi:hypothetical protein
MLRAAGKASGSLRTEAVTLKTLAHRPAPVSVRLPHMDLLVGSDLKVRLVK